MQVKCNFLKVNKLNTNPPKATFYCKLQCFLHLRTCLKTPQKSANQNLELSPPPPPELPPGQQLKAIFIAFRHQLGPPHPPPSLSVILPSATALSVISMHLFPWHYWMIQGETYCTYGCMAFFLAEAGHRIWAFFRLSWAS